jgi:hypothetical protein
LLGTLLSSGSLYCRAVSLLDDDQPALAPRPMANRVAPSPFLSGISAGRGYIEESKSPKEWDEKAVHTVDPRRRDEHIRRLTAAGIDIATVHKNDQFELRDWTDTHLRDGQFDQHRTLSLFQKSVRGAKGSSTCYGRGSDGRDS